VQLADATRRYLVQLQADGRAASTIAQYERHLRLLDRWLAGTGRTRDIRRLTHEDIAVFLISPEATRRPDGASKKATAMNVLRSSLRAFFGYLHAVGRAPRNAAALVRRAKCGPAPPRTLPPADCQRLLAWLAKKKDPRGRRDHALFSLLLGAGLRIGSAVALRVEDLDLDQGIAHLQKDKGDRPAEVFLSAGVVRTLRAHLGRRSEGPVFESGPGTAIDVRQARRRLMQALEAAGIKRRATPHSLRHAFAINLLTRTQNLRLVQKAMHHASIGSTCAYAAVADDAVRRALAG